MKKRTVVTKNAVPLEKEQQKTQKCRSFGKGTTEIQNAVPLEKEQQNKQSQQHKKNTQMPFFYNGKNRNFEKEKEQQKNDKKTFNSNICTRTTQRQELMYKL